MKEHLKQEPEMANPELAGVEIETVSRSDLLMKGVLAAGAVYGVAMAGPFLRQAFAQSGSGDVEILNFALTLEYLEAAFYEEAQTRVSGSSELMDLIEQIGTDEQEHVAALTASIRQLGAKPVKAPKVSFPYGDTAGFLKLAQTFEDTGVSAYNGAAPAIKSKAVLASAGSIVQVEARHAAAIRLQNKTQPAPDAFDPTLSQSKVEAAVMPFIK